MFPQDVTYVLRLHFRQRALTVASILTIGLVVGATTCVFALLYGVMFRQLPYMGADRLVMLWESNRDTGAQRLPITLGAYPFYKRHLTRLDGVGAFMPRLPNMPPVSMAGTNQQVLEAYIGAELLRVLGVRPILGRGFEEADSSYRAPLVLLLSFRLWQSAFNGRADIVGQDVVLNDLGEQRKFTVVGVMPESFDFPYPLLPGKPDLWKSLRYAEDRFDPGNFFYVLARLRPGVSLDDAANELSAAARRISLERPIEYGHMAVSLVPLQAEVVQNAGPVVWALAGTLLFVVLIGCANLAHLMLARACVRSPEFAVRRALGATSFQLLRLTTLEAGILVALGGVLAIVLAWWGLATLPSLLPPSVHIPRADALAFDPRVIAFAACCSLVTAVGLGVVIGRQAIRWTLDGELVGVQRVRSTFRPGIRRPSAALLVFEIAFAFALASGAVFMVQYLRAMLDSGMRRRADHLLSMNVYFPNEVPPDVVREAAAFDAFLLRTRALPAVQSVALANHFPLAEGLEEFGTTEGGAQLRAAGISAGFHIVSPGYADVVGLELKSGRWLGNTDTRLAEPVAVINEAMARQLASTGQVLGTRLWPKIRRSKDGPAAWRVVGIVKEGRRLDTGREAPPAVFVPLAQEPMRNISILARTRISARRVAASVRDEALRIAPGAISIENLESGNDLVARWAGRQQFVSSQLSAAAALALLLAALGAYGVMSFYASRRTREIGIRIAVGSTNRQILWLIVRETLQLVLIGIGIGFPLALGLVHALAAMNGYDRDFDPRLYFGVAGLFCIVGVASALHPALRAASIDPVEALRTE